METRKMTILNYFQVRKTRCDMIEILILLSCLYLSIRVTDYLEKTKF